MRDLVDRNSTSFAKDVYDKIKEITIKEVDPLRYHQRIVHEYVVQNPKVRGLLINHKMGAGKSILAVAIADSLKDKYQVILLSSKSLRNNFVDNIDKYLKMLNPAITPEEISAYIKQHYSFVSTNASNMIKQIYRVVKREKVDVYDDSLESFDVIGNLDNRCIIVDEAHNLFNSISNGSKNAVALYYLILKAKNIKVLFLTGTPIVNDPYESAICFNMLAGLSKNKETLFGEDYETFTKYFVGIKELRKGDKKRRIPTIRNKDKYVNRIMGLVSYYDAKDPEQALLFPKQHDIVVERVPMTQQQYISYAAARDKELEEENRSTFRAVVKKELSKPKGRSSSYRVRSRQISNFLYPEYALEKIYVKGFQKTIKRIDKLSPEDLSIESLANTYSSKIARMLSNITKLPGSGVIYSQFIDSGVGLVGRVLEVAGYKRVEKAVDISKPGRGYAIISGDIDTETRSEIVKIYNSAENMRGEIIHLLLITSTGAEGIDLKNGRHIHILEPFWNWGRIGQVIARIVRMGSHMMLPEDERDVRVFVYLSDYPKYDKIGSAETGSKGSEKINEASSIRDSEVASVVEEHAEGDDEVGKEEQEIRDTETEYITPKLEIKDISKDIRERNELTTDVNIYARAIQSQILTNSFLDAIRSASIDCMVHKPEGVTCVYCNPTGDKLFDENLDRAMKTPNPCAVTREQEVEAEEYELEIGKVKRKFALSGDRLFELQEDIGGYVEIKKEDPYYIQIMDRLKKS